MRSNKTFNTYQIYPCINAQGWRAYARTHTAAASCIVWNYGACCAHSLRVCCVRTPTNSPFTAMAGPPTWACARAWWPRKTKHLLPMLLLLLGASRQTNADCCSIAQGNGLAGWDTHSFNCNLGFTSSPEEDACCAAGGKPYCACTATGRPNTITVTGAGAWQRACCTGLSPDNILACSKTESVSGCERLNGKLPCHFGTYTPSARQAPRCEVEVFPYNSNKCVDSVRSACVKQTIQWGTHPLCPNPNHMCCEAGKDPANVQPSPGKCADPNLWTCVGNFEAAGFADDDGKPLCGSKDRYCTSGTTTRRPLSACESGRFHPNTGRCVIGVCGDPTTHNCLPNTPETCFFGSSIFVSCKGGYQTAAYTLNGRTPCGAGELFCATGELERQPGEGENCSPASSGGLGVVPGVCFDPRSLTTTCHHVTAVVAKTWTVTTAADINLPKKCAGMLECCAG